jgi:hypothetical protein
MAVLIPHTSAGSQGHPVVASHVSHFVPLARIDDTKHLLKREMTAKPVSFGRYRVKSRSAELSPATAECRKQPVGSPF